MIRYHLECNGCGWWTGNNHLTHCRWCETPLRASRPADYIRRGIPPAMSMTRRDVKNWVRTRSSKTRPITMHGETIGTAMRPSTAEFKRWLRDRTTPVPVRMWIWNAYKYRQATRT